jgi:Chitobiase/beta-hexosaminidase C-terminal domain
MVYRNAFLGLLLCAVTYASAQMSITVDGKTTILSSSQTHTVSVSSAQDAYTIDGVTTTLSASTPHTVVVNYSQAAGTTAPPPTIAGPVFAPAGGTYSTAQKVSLSSPAVGESICYAINSTPAADVAGTCTAGTKYTGGFYVSSTSTVNALSTEVGYTNSPIVSAAYTISTSPTPSATGTAITACGPITAAGNYYLANDVNCTTVGFPIEADNVKFNLNGHTIHYGNSSTSLSAFTLCDAWYNGDNYPIDPNECQGGSYSGLEVYGGTISENSSAAPFSHAFLLGQGNGLGNLGGYIHDLTVNIGCGGGNNTCVGAQFMHGDFPGGHWKIANNVINDTVTFIEKPGQGPLGARSQYQGYAIHMDDGENSSSPANDYENNTFNGTPQGGIADSIQNTVINSNTCNLTSSYSNDYCAILTAQGQRATYNTVSGRGRGFSIESNNVNVSNNTITVHEETNNTEYSGCELDGTYGIRLKDFSPTAPLTGITVANNAVTVDGTNCEARAFAITNSFPSATATIAYNTFLTTGTAHPTYGLKLNSFNQSPFVWTANTFGGQYCVEIGNDGDIGSGANAKISAGQTWNCGSVDTVFDKDMATQTSGQTYSQALTIPDTVSNPSVLCYSNTSAMVKIGSYSHQCPN